MPNASSNYPTDLNDAQWNLLQPLLPGPSPIGRPRTCDLRQILNAIFYGLQAGGAWRLLPRDFGPWSTVYGYFRRWSQAGVWAGLNTALRESVRVQAGPLAQPSAAILDSQSVKTSDQACAGGIDVHKQIEGVQRHILVDTLGLLLGVVVTAASVQDRDGAKTVWTRCGPGLIRLARVWADAGYAGALVAWLNNFQPERALTLEIVRRAEGQKGFAVLPRRWVVERTLAWLVKRRRLARHYEQRPDHNEGFIYLAMISLMLRRLTKSQERV